jgi:hypothetical protein
MTRKFEMSHVAQKMSHVAQKNEPSGIKNRAVWHLPFLYKYWYNFFRSCSYGLLICRQTLNAERKMGILDSLKKAATDGLKSAASATTKAVATSSSRAMESVIAKTTALVGSKIADAISNDLAGSPPNPAASPNAAPSPNTASPQNPEASAKAAALVGSKAAQNEQPDAGLEPNKLSPAEVEAIIDARVRAKGNPSNWRYSIVDLMTALDMNSSLDSRKALAARLNYYGYDADGSAEKNTWLHAELLKALAQNGGEVPSNLL